ncbi:hypothetical protein GCM10018793_03500 [Streptomyces sulfonofaciens]|uniref:Uncharacterized protein n=1 Tax=Streptomyces sulfonofaciens TaxID=68272 RepID=A0A919FQE0_9ACTN|nr:hypothetical protein GCM10018793_03500 [Streptomyces sulfonofaciens]
MRTTPTAHEYLTFVRARPPWSAADATGTSDAADATDPVGTSDAADVPRADARAGVLRVTSRRVRTCST